MSAALLVGCLMAAGSATGSAGAVPGWSIVSAGALNTQNDNFLLGSVCADAWSCWSVGASLPGVGNHGNPRAFAEHWDGSTWSEVSGVVPPGTSGSLLYDVTCPTPSDCWAVGVQSNGTSQGTIDLIEHWNGIAWAVLPTPAMSGFLFSVSCVGVGDCWAVGSTLDPVSGGPLHSYALHWDGATWTPVTLPSSGQSYDQVTGIACVTGSDCWAVGAAGPNPMNGALVPNVFTQTDDSDSWTLHWNGTSWSGAPMADPANPTGAILSGVTCVTTSECWAVGSTMGQNSQPLATIIERWNGTSWAVTPSPNVSTNDGLANVACLSATRCWAVGANATAASSNQANPNSDIERWNGTSWSLDSTPTVTALGFLFGVACIPGSRCFATGLAGTAVNPVSLQPLIEQTEEPAIGGQGFDAAGADGGVFNFGDAGFFGSMGGSPLNAPVVGVATTPDRGGYWLVGSDGGVFAFGDARFFGSMGGVHLDAPVVGLAATPDGGGYWEVAADGGVFAFGDARFFGSMGGALSGHPVTGVATTPDGGGYWEVAADGGVFAFGDAPFEGSVPSQGLVSSTPVRSISISPDGRGYWLVAADGALDNFGDASWVGSLAGVDLSAPITGVTGPA